MYLDEEVTHAAIPEPPLHPARKWIPTRPMYHQPEYDPSPPELREILRLRTSEMPEISSEEATARLWKRARESKTPLGRKIWINMALMGSQTRRYPNNLFPVIDAYTGLSVEKKFNLPPAGEYTECWETETFVPDRIEELLRGYQDRELDEEEKVCLMAIILNSWVHLDPHDPRMETFWPQLHTILEEDRDLHQQLIAYYADDDNHTAQTPRIVAARLRTAFPGIVNSAPKPCPIAQG